MANKELNFMKYLLSILILFSGLSFSSTYLICDEPYYFYPDQSKRIIIDFYDDKNFRQYWISNYDKLTVVEEVYTYLKYEDKYTFYINNEYLFISRITGKYRDLQCESVNNFEGNKAIKNLRLHSNKLKAKRKI